MRKSRKKPIKVPRLQYLALKARSEMIDDQEMSKIDVTEQLHEAIANHIENGELVVGTITGPTSGGKSCVGITLADYGNDIIEELGLNHSINRKEAILADQMAFNRFMLNPDRQNTFVVIDEHNSLGDGGANATSESQVFQNLVEVQAQRFIHRISISPSKTYDPTAWFRLEILGMDKKKKRTRVFVYYINVSNNSEQLVGYADIDVSRILDKPYYQAYRLKKFKRMEFLHTHGIRDERQLEQAAYILKTYDELKELADLGGEKITNDVISPVIDSILRKERRIYSFIAKGEITTGARGLLALHTALGKTNEKLKKESITPTKRLALEKKKDILSEKLTESVAEYKKLISILDEYYTIDVTGAEVNGD